MFNLRLKTKLVLAISSMVVAVVAILSSIFVSQLVHQRIDEAFQNGEFVSLEVFHSAREALEADLSNTRLDPSNEAQMRSATEESLQTDAGLNSLLQSIVGYSPTIYDVAITDNSGKAIMHSDASLIGKSIAIREDFAEVRQGGFRRQVQAVYGDPRVYEMRLPLKRDGKPFATIRVGVSTVFLKGTLQPKLNRALVFATFSILISLIVAAVLSNLALRPLEAISRRLDEMGSETFTGEGETSPPPQRPKDEVGVVNTKIDRLGQQMRDVKEVFSALKENLDQMMSNLQDGVMLFTRDEKAVLVSSSVEQFLGRSRAELLGKEVGEIFSTKPRIARVVQDAFRLHEPVSQLEVLGESSGKSNQRVQVSVDFIEEHGERMGALVTLRDAESVHRIEDELELSRRMAAVGRLTSGVAHEVKNPINAIVVHLEVLRQKLHDLEPDEKRHMDVIGSEIRRLDRVVQTLVDFTRPMELRLTELDLRRVLEDVIMLSTPDAEKHGVHIVKKMAEEPLRVKVDVDLVKQALLNIMINGMQAMTNGGNLSIETRRKDGFAIVQVTDQGGGIPLEIREKIFNLYFTTKSGGTGIGLPMSYRVVQLHNGSVEFDSVPGEGTSFSLSFPLVEGASDAAEWMEHSRSQSTVEG